MEKKILRLLAAGALPADQVAARVGVGEAEVREALAVLRKPGFVERSTMTPGNWHITDTGRARLEQLEAGEK